MANRDFYWTGAVDTDGRTNGNWEDLAGGVMAGYPGDTGGDDRAFLLGARAVNQLLTWFGPPETWTRGGEMDLAYATLYPGATLSVNNGAGGGGGVVLNGNVIMYGSGVLTGNGYAQNAITTLHLHGTSGADTNFINTVACDVSIWDGAHVYLNGYDDGLGSPVSVVNVHIMNISADGLPSLIVGDGGTGWGVAGVIVSPDYLPARRSNS